MFTQIQKGNDKEYLLVPAKPAPNGPLHLGHASGPYLRLDMFARYLRRRGDKASIIFGTDPYDSFIPLRAEQEGTTPDNIARKNYLHIKDDLNALNIEVDCFLDPLENKWKEMYAKHHVKLVQALNSVGLVKVVTERLPYSISRNKFVTGSWLLGNCLHCNEKIAGFFCESCGTHLQPSSVLNPMPRWGNENLVFRETVNLFYENNHQDILLEQLTGTETPRPFVEIVQNYLIHHGIKMRLTENTDWGIDYFFEAANERRTLFGHGLLFAYCLMIGEIYKEIYNKEINPFHCGSDVITVNGFGVDNVISHMVGIQSMAMAKADYKPFDRFIINYFYNLEGKKFSTSARHVIWVSELFKNMHISSDAIRYYLALTNPSDKQENFDMRKFSEFLNLELAENLNLILKQSIFELQKNKPVELMPNSLCHLLEELLLQQDKGFDFATFDPRQSAKALNAWINAVPAEDKIKSSYWWLKGFSLLAYPIMPKLSQEIWTLLGAEGFPQIEKFLVQSTPMATRKISEFRHVTYEEFRSNVEIQA